MPELAKEDDKTIVGENDSGKEYLKVTDSIKTDQEEISEIAHTEPEYMQAEIRKMLPVYSRHSKESLAKSYNIKNRPVKDFTPIKYQSESALNVSQNEMKKGDYSEEVDTPPRST